MARSAASASAVAASMSLVATIVESSFAPGKNNGFSCRSLIAATIARLRAHNIGVEPARRATTLSAVPQAPAPMIANRFIWPVSSACSLSSNPGLLRRGVKRPARSEHRIEAVGQTETKALDNRPGNHRRVVGAQFRRWRDKAQPAVSGEGCQAMAQLPVGRDAAGGHQAFSIWVMVAEPGNSVCRAIDQRLADGA